MASSAPQRQKNDHARFFEGASDLFAVTSLEGYFKLLNPAWETTLGYTVAHLQSLPLLTFVHPDDAADTWAVIERSVTSRVPTPGFENRYRAKDGSYRWLQWNDVKTDGELIYAIARDVTDRKNAEAQLRKSEAQLARAQRIARIGHWESDLKTDTLLWSDEMFRICGLAPGGPLRRCDFFNRVHPDDRTLVRDAIEHALATNSPLSVDHRITLPGGAVRWVHEQADVALDSGERPARLIGTMQDTTQYKLMEERVMQSQKMDAVGRLAGGIAHDFNNLLTLIIGYGEMLSTQLSDRPELKRYAEESLSAADRAAAFTQQLLALSRRQMVQPRVINLNGLICGMEPLLRRLAGPNINVSVLLAPELGRVKADPVQIDQVILNLAVNATHAMGSGGTMTIETANVTLGHGDVPPGEYVMLAVSDTGGGIDSATMKHIFEPFFTTKSDGEGTGLGLSTVYGIVHQIGGEVAVESNPGCGAAFRVYLPRTYAPGEAVLPGRSALPAAQGTETILLAEDDSGVRTLVAETLRRHGYRVLPASGAAEALQLVREHEHPIHLLVTDLHMPKMNGRELAARILALQPAMRVLFVSGYPDGAAPAEGPGESRTSYLGKPFTPGTLAHRIREALDR